MDRQQGSNRMTQDKNQQKPAQSDDIIVAKQGLRLQKAFLAISDVETRERLIAIAESFARTGDVV
jgi:hypothetical protein